MIFYQLKNGYRYNSDTIFLYDFISKNKLFGDVLDLGCGCGILGFLLKKKFENLNLTSLDLQQINCEITSFNAKINHLEVQIICEDFFKFKNNKFDFIVSNPPFYHDGAKKSQNLHLSQSRYSSFLNLKDLINGVNSIIEPRGTFYFCYDSKRISEVINTLAIFKFNITKLRFIHTKSDRLSKIFLIEAKKSSKSACEILPPLIIFDNAQYSLEVKKIFSQINTKSEVYNEN